MQDAHQSLKVQDAAGMSIIVPIKVRDLGYLDGFPDCYRTLLGAPMLEGRLQVIVVDDSPEEVYAEIDSWFSSEDVTHFRPPRRFMTGENNKMNSIQSAMRYVSRPFTLVLDDDFRPSVAALSDYLANAEEGDCSFIKAMITYRRFNLVALIHGCSTFMGFVVKPHRQMGSHIGFKTDDLKEIGFPSKNGLFDELTFQEHFDRAGKKVCQIEDVFLEKVPNEPEKVLEQRVRYAYEWQALPGRFLLLLGVIPTVLFSRVLGRRGPVLLVALLTVASWALALFGQLRRGRQRWPAYTWLLAPLAFWPYPVGAWVSLIHRLKGGYPFGGRRVKEPV